MRSFNGWGGMMGVLIALDLSPLREGDFIMALIWFMGKNILPVQVCSLALGILKHAQSSCPLGGITNSTGKTDYDWAHWLTEATCLSG